MGVNADSMVSLLICLMFIIKVSWAVMFCFLFNLFNCYKIVCNSTIQWWNFFKCLYNHDNPKQKCIERCGFRS